MAGSDDPKPDAKAAMTAAARDAAQRALWPQGELLGLPVNTRVERLRADKRAKGGRPPGARNRRSEDVARYVTEKIGDPLVVLAQLAVMPADELAAAAGCKVIEALTEKRLAAIAVLPYLHRRQPLAVDVSNHRVVHLHIGEGPGPADDASRAPGVTLLGNVVDVVENQGDSDGDDDAV